MQSAKGPFRLAAGLIAVWLVLATMLLIWQIWSSQREERALALRQTERRAGQLAIAVAEHIAVFTRAVDFVLLELRREYATEGVRFRDTVALLMKSFPQGTILQLSLANANGDVSYSSLGPAQAVSIRDREHFTAHLGGGDRLYISKPVLGRVSGKWSIQFTRPVLRDGRFAGVIVASVAPEYLSQVLALSDMSPTDSASLFHSDGVYVARDHALNEVIGKNAPPSRLFLAADAPARGAFRADPVMDSADWIFGWARVPGTPLIANIGLDLNAEPGPREQRFKQRWANAGVFALVFVALGSVPLALVFRLERRRQALIASEARLRVASERLQMLIRCAPLAVYTLDANGLLRSWNPAAEKMYGWKAAEVLGKPLPTLPEGTRAEFEGLRQRLLAGEPFIQHETRRLRRDGSPVDIDLALGPLRDAAGNIEGTIAVAVDITARMRAQELLLASADRYRDLVEHSEDLICTHDLEGRLLSVNQAVPNALGYPHDALLGMNLCDLLTPGARAHFPAYLAGIRQRGSAEGVMALRTAGGEVRYWEFHNTLREANATAPMVRGMAHDITQRRRAERAMAKSEARFRDLVELSTDWYWEQDADLRFTFVSPGLNAKIALAPASVLGKLRWELPIVGISEEQWQAHRALLARREPFHDFVYEIMDENGVKHWTSVSGKPVFGENGQFLGYRGTAHDITERTRSHEALIESEAQLREAQRMARFGNWELNLVNNVLTWSDEVFRIFEIDAERLGAPYEAFLAAVHPDDRAAVDAAYAHSLRERTPYAITHRLLMSDGRIKYVHLRYQTDCDERGRPLRATGTVQDISEQKRVEAELKDAAYRLREVYRELAQVQEAERRQVAAELHDSMGRDLTALAIDIDLIRAQLPAQLPAGVEDRLDDAQALVGAAMQNVRSVVAGLRPPLLEEWGLPPALRWHAAEFSKRFAIPVEVAITAQETRLPDKVELALFRVAQEALLNCAKHARAKRIDIGLEAIYGRTTLTVTDDGVGFVPEDMDSGRTIAGLGLTLMRERMEAVGGRLQVNSSLGRRTTITAVTGS